MYKVLALDLDGTVLTDEHTINPEVKRAIQEAKQHCNVVIVTGRHHTAAKPYYEELGLTTPIICCNGTYIYDYQNDCVIQHNAISKQDALSFISLAHEYQMKMVMYVTDSMTYSSHNPITYMQALESWAEQFEGHSKPKIEQIDSFGDLVNETQYVWKFVVEGQPSSVERLLEHDYVKRKFNGERSWSNRIDFAALGNNKGALLAEYVTNLGYHANHVLAVGDNHNDISMLKYAGLGVAMENADDTVKNAARIVCETNNNEDGLARLIRNKIKG